MGFVLLTILTLVPIWLAVLIFLWLKGSVLWAVSGERDAILCTGLGSTGRRIRRTAHMHDIVNALATATNLNQPLGPSLTHIAQTAPQDVRASLEQIAHMLERGMPIHYAFEQVVCRCPPLAVDIIRNGELSGQASRALAMLNRMIGDRLNDHLTLKDGNHAGLYAVIMFALIAHVFVFCMSIIMPRYQMIFADFGQTLPPLTIALWDLHMWIWSSPLLLPFALLIGLACCLFLVPIFFGAWLGTSKNDSGLPAGFVAWIRSYLPMLRRVDFALGMSTAIRSMALGVRAGLPLQRTLQLAATVGPHNFVRERLVRFADAVKAGVPPQAAARDANLGSIFTTSLAAIERGHDPVAALTYAADYYHAGATRWWRILRSMVVPGVTLAFACVVATIALAMFLPLVRLIEAVAETVL